MLCLSIGPVPSAIVLVLDISTDLDKGDEVSQRS